MDEINKLLQRIADLTTADYFPAIYSGFVEADALVQGEDSLLGLIREYVIQLWQNRNLLSMTEEKTAEFENRLHIPPSASQTLDDRRQAVADAINERFVLNDATLHEICQGLAPNFTVYEKTDPQALTLGVFTTEDGEDGELPAVGIVDTIRPTVPQNLALYAGVETTFERVTIINHANFSALKASLGKVVKRAPDPNIIVVDNDGKIIGGLLESVTAEALGTLTMPDGGIVDVTLGTAGLSEPDLVIVEQPEEDYIDVLLGAKWTGSEWRIVDAGANDWWWGGVLSQEDRTILENFGLEFRNDSFYGPYGNIEWSDDFTFEPLAVYSDEDGQNLVTDDMGAYGFYCTSSTNYSSSWRYSLIVWNVEPCQYRTWKCRITKLS